ncbi:MAG: microcin C ABC transporter permease YejB [Alphaproteobacteria bacterium]|nr:microcin C ABC transporter permease YejB [Alphaproteobacteria bacterium]
MTAYILRRLLLIPPTLFGILLVNFIIIQAAPGGPVEQMIAKIQGTSVDATARLSGASSDSSSSQQNMQTSAQESKYRGSRGLDPEFIAQLEKMYGFDKPAYERFWIMLKNYACFDFGESYFKDRKVVDLIIEKLPVSISLGLWTTLLIYFISIPLGISKAVRDGSAYDIWTSSIVIVGYAIPGFLFAIMLIVLLAGGSFVQIFPLRGLVSDNWDDYTWYWKILDYFWHMTLPILSLVISGFASLTLLTKNSFVEEINKQYVLTAMAKGLTRKRVMYGHVFRNAMLIIIGSLPSAFIGILFTGALLVEYIFSLDGLGLLSFESALSRDYPVLFGSLFIFTLIGLVSFLIGDLTYMLVDPRIDFAKRQG